MPLSDVANKVEAPENKEFQAIPEDVYQVVIKDVDEKIMKKFKSEEEEAFYQFKFAVLDEGENIQGQSLVAYCSRKWFGGNKKMQPSKLVTLIGAIYSFYYPRLSVIELEAEDITYQAINDLIGKQLRVMVKMNEDKTGNKIVQFMGIKKELPVPETVKVAAVSKKALARPQTTTNENHEELQDDPTPAKKPAKAEEKDASGTRPLPWESDEPEE